MTAATALGLKVIRPDGTTDGNEGRPAFPWPLTVGAEVVAPDWSPDDRCGRGLHFWPFGEGDLSVVDEIHDDTLIWQVVAYDPSTAIDLRGKVKVQRCTVVMVGTGTKGRAECATYIATHAPGHRTHFATATAGYNGTATAGYNGTATAGYNGTATAGLGGSISILWYDATQNRWRRAVGEVDGVVLRPGVAYRVGGGKLVVAK